MKRNQPNYTALRNARLKKEATEKEKMGLFYWGDICPITGMPIKDVEARKRDEYFLAWRKKKQKKEEIQ